MFWLFLCYGWALYEFFDLWGLHSSFVVHGFLESPSFKGFLWGRLILGEAEFLCAFMLLVVFGLGTNGLQIL